MLKPVRSLKEHWFYGPVFKAKSIYFQVILASILISIFALASSLYIMTVYDLVIPNNATVSLIALTTIIVVVVLFDFVMKIIRGNFVDRASLRIDREVSTELFDKISRHDTTLGRQATGALASTVRDFDLLKDVIGSATFTIFADLPFILLFLVVLYAIGGPVAAVPAVIVPLVILFGLLLQPIIKRMSELSLMQGKSKQAVMVEMIGALEGEVIHVASNTTEEQNIPPYYETLIAIGDKGFPNSNIVPEIVPGMQVTVDIIGGKRTVLNYILSPIQKAASVAFSEK